MSKTTLETNPVVTFGKVGPLPSLTTNCPQCGQHDLVIRQGDRLHCNRDGIEFAAPPASVLTSDLL
jgi:ribosomal protein S27AE